jgi:outer membrane lipoprotein carrier protein
LGTQERERIMMFRTAITLVVLSATSLAAPVRAQTVTSTIDRAVAAWSKAKTARASFEQTITNALTGGSATSHGEFVQQRPDRLSITFKEDGGRVVSDGKSLWIYMPTSTPGQVIKRRAEEDGAGVPIDITSQFLDEPRTKYDITDAGRASSGEEAHVLALVPKAGQSAPFVRAKVWVSDKDGLIREFEVVEPSGVTRHVHLSSLDLNVPVDRSAFTFAVPKGVKVVDQTR